MKTGIVDHELFTDHTMRDHPENAARLRTVRHTLDMSTIRKELVAIKARPATMNELRRCHEHEYIVNLETICRIGGGMLNADTYVNEFSFNAAVHAVGGMIDLADAIMCGQLSNGFALTRPPGHHALPAESMGFCLFNTIALTAFSLLESNQAQRVAIVDFDVHHGNGTQVMCGGNRSILFLSSHQFPYYPGSGSLRESGIDGNVVNLPLPQGTGDKGLRQCYSQIAFPILQRFQPDMILVSAGFDGHWKDHLAGLTFSLSGYHWLISSLMRLAEEVCEGRIAFCLEGGYHNGVLARGVLNTFLTLLGKSDAITDEFGPSPSEEPDISPLVHELHTVHNLQGDRETELFS